MATGDTFFDNDGKAVQVHLTYSVVKNQVAVVEGIVGIAATAGDSGDDVALSIDFRAYQFVVPSGLSVSKGQTVYVEIADLTGHTPDSTAYSTTAGAGKHPLFRALEDKDSNNVVIGKFYGGLGLI